MPNFPSVVKHVWRDREELLLENKTLHLPVYWSSHCLNELQNCIADFRPNPIPWDKCHCLRFCISWSWHVSEQASVLDPQVVKYIPTLVENYTYLLGCPPNNQQSDHRPVRQTSTQRNMDMQTGSMYFCSTNARIVMYKQLSTWSSKFTPAQRNRSTPPGILRLMSYKVVKNDR